MPSDVTREEFKHWTARVDVLESEVEGEKKITRHILAETRRNTADLAGMRTDMKGMRTEMKGMRTDITSIRTDLVNLDRNVDRLEVKMDGLIKTLPTIVGDVVRKVMGGRGKKS